MKSNRNAPCPCRSGKKYKDCCYPKDRAKQATAANTEEEQEYLHENRTGGGYDEDRYFDYQQTLLNMFNNLRRFDLDRKPHIQEYYKIRKMHQEVVDAMVKYHEDGKFEQKIDPNFVIPGDEASSSKRPQKVRLIESKFDFNTREGAHAFYDLQIYKPAPNMNCITEEFIQSRRYRKPEKIEFLHSMLSSRLGLFKITGTDMTEGYVYLKDVFTGDEYKMIDVGLSGSKMNDDDDVYVYTRIITYHDINFGTGFSLFFSASDGFIENYINTHKKDYSPIGEFLRFSELYNYHSKFPGKIKITANEL